MPMNPNRAEPCLGYLKKFVVEVIRDVTRFVKTVNVTLKLNVQSLITTCLS